MSEKVKLSDFKVIPDINSVRREDISDEIYFSNNYAHYISNSRLKWIDPKANGNPALFKSNPKIINGALELGSAIHELLLQNELFELAPKVGKPGEKLGRVFDLIPKYLKENMSLDEAIKCASLKVDYYSKCIDSKIDSIKNDWNAYLSRLTKLPEETEKIRRIVSDKNWDIVNACVKSCNNNPEIFNKLHPKDIFGNPIESHYEDAFFINYIVTYKNKYCAILPFKMKADNWTIDYENKIVTLNDLKTTGHSVNDFMLEGRSFDKFSYARQMAVYSEILMLYLMKNNGVSYKNGWHLNTNMLVVETIPNNWSRCFNVKYEQLSNGKLMLRELLARVAYCEMFGYDKEIEFK